MTIKLFNTEAVIAVIIIMVFLAPNFAGGATSATSSSSGGGAIHLPNPLGKTETIGQLVINIVRFLIRLVFYIAPIMVVYAGFTYATAAGNEERIKLAQRVLVWALIGLALALIAQAVPNLLYEFFTGHPPEKPIF